MPSDGKIFLARNLCCMGEAVWEREAEELRPVSVITQVVSAVCFAQDELGRVSLGTGIRVMLHRLYLWYADRLYHADLAKTAQHASHNEPKCSCEGFQHPRQLRSLSTDFFASNTDY